MAEIKTKPTSASVSDFLKMIEPEEKRTDSLEIAMMMEEITGEKPVMWGESLIGFGKYHYKSERSRQEGDWPLIAFSPRKANLSIYLMAGVQEYIDLLEKLGKHKVSVGCLYIKRLSDVDKIVLRELIKSSYEYMARTHNKG